MITRKEVSWKMEGISKNVCPPITITFSGILCQYEGTSRLWKTDSKDKFVLVQEIFEINAYEVPLKS